MTFDPRNARNFVDLLSKGAMSSCQKARNPGDDPSHKDGGSIQGAPSTTRRELKPQAAEQVPIFNHTRLAVLQEEV